MGGETQAWIDQAEGETGEVKACDHAGVAGGQNHASGQLGGDDRIGGDVAGAAEILQQGGADLGLEHDVRQSDHDAALRSDCTVRAAARASCA